MKFMMLIASLAIYAATAAATPPLPTGASDSPAFGNAQKLLSQFTFDSDNQDWQGTYVGMPPGATYETLYANGPADFKSGDGIPPGSIYQAVDSDIGSRAYWMGYYGDVNFFGDLTGKWLRMSITSSGNWETLAAGADGDDGNVYARWVVSVTNPADPGQFDMFISRRTQSIDLNAVSGWEVHEVELVESNFIRWPNGAWGAHSFASLMYGYDQVGLYIFSGTDDSADIDGGAGTWLNDNGTSRLKHYGAYDPTGEATWGLDNLEPVPGSVGNEDATWSEIKTIYR